MTNENYDTIVASRKGKRSYIRAVVNKCKTVNEETALASVKGYIATLEKELEEIRQVDNQLNELIIKSFLSAKDAAALQQRDETMSNFWADAGNFTLEVVTAISALQLLVDKQQPTTSIPAPQNAHSCTSHTKVNPLLKKIVIPKYDGNTLQFGEFWSRFNHHIHNPPNPQFQMTDADKLAQLKEILIGEAASVVLNVEPDGYQDAVNDLKRRFGRRVPRMAAHLGELLKIDVPPVHNVKGLREAVNTMLTNVRGLSSMKVVTQRPKTDTSHSSATTDQNTSISVEERLQDTSVVMACILFFKLPQAIRLQWSRQYSEDDLDIFTLLEFLQKEVEGRETIEVSQQHFQDGCNLSSGHQASGSSKSDKPKAATKQYDSPRSTGAFYTGEASATQLCCFCKKKHSSDTCGNLSSIPIKKRIQLVREAKRCVRCLTTHHRSKDHNGEVSCDTCDKDNHHRFLCYRKDKSETQGKSDETFNGLVNAEKFQNVMMQTACVNAESKKNKSVMLRLITDGGSEFSYITKKAVDRLGLKPVDSKHLNIEGFGGQRSGAKHVNVYSVKLHNRHTNDVVEIQATQVDCICRKTFPYVSKDLLKSSHLKNLQMADLIEGEIVQGPKEIQLLIGLDHYWEIHSGETRLGGRGQPAALASMFGWILSGPDNSSTPKTSLTTSNFTTSLFTSPEKPEDLFRQFFEAEGTGDDFEDVDPIVQHFDDHVQFNGERYRVALPWKPEHPPLLNNRRQAFQRLQSLRKMLDRHPELKSDYEKALQDMIDSDFVEPVQHDEKTSSTVFYLPHHPVVKPSSSTTRVRPVFDASAKGPNKVSLNDCLFAGPSLTPNLLYILLRFRTHAVVFMSDAAKAYLQLELYEDDRDVHRFLWIKDGNIITYRFKRVTFGIISSAFLLNATVRHHLKTHPHPTLQYHLEEDIYVDNISSGEVDEASALTKARFCNDSFKEMGMELRKWTSNSKYLMDQFKADSMPLCEDQRLSNLGVEWDVKLDSLQLFNVPYSLKTKVTKRFVSSRTLSMFDPAGFASPISIRGKMLMQKLWKEKLDWDDELPQAYVDEFRDLEKDLANINKLALPRCVVNSGPMELHLFTDASPQAYASVIYIKCGDRVDLLLSKARVAPLKEQTLPRLELMGAHLGAKVLHTVLEKVPALKNASITCWSDSRIVLAWIQSEAEAWKPFVSNRVKLIRGYTDTKRWFHCPGSDNPSDLATRGKSDVDTLLSTFWRHGPPWLSADSDSWPVQVEVLDDAASKELLKEKRNVTQVLLQASVPTNDEPLFDMTKYSSLGKALRVTSLVFRACHKFLLSKKLKILNPHIMKAEDSGSISLDEVCNAELFWVRDTQRRILEDRLDKLWKLGPEKDENGIVRSVGRTSRVEEVYPVLLPPDSHFTRLLINQFHCNEFHSGVNQTLSSIRQHFWIIRGRQVTRSVINECRICRKFRARHYQQQESALPKFRIEKSTPFEYTGIDFAGPVPVSEGKVWIALFTCAVTRNVHLEVVNSLSTADFLLAYRRFKAERGKVRFIYSDNGKTFVQAKKQLAGKVNWRFIPEYGPWWGGIWESLVKVMKSHLKKFLGRALLEIILLQTVLKEIQCVMNHRPISAVTDDREDPSPLRPIDFLITPCLDKLPDIDLSESIKRRQSLVDSAWIKWNKEYLSFLRSWHLKKSGAGFPQVGDVVLLEAKGLPKNRSLYPLGRIQSLITGRDGFTRAVYVNVKGKIIRRPTRLVYPLETTI